MKSQLMLSGRQSPAHWKCTLVHLLCARRSGRKDDEHELVPVPRGSQGSERRPGLALLQRSFSLGQSGRCGAGRSGNLRKPRQRGDELQPCIRMGIMATAQTVQCGRPGFSPWVGRSPGEGNGNPLQYSCLEKPMDRGARLATVHRVEKSGT